MRTNIHTHIRLQSYMYGKVQAQLLTMYVLLALDTCLPYVLTDST